MKIKWNFFKYVSQWIHQPKLILIFCGILIFLNIIFDGTLFQIRTLYLQKRSIIKNSREVNTKNEVILNKIQQLSDPKNLEKEVINRFDLASEGDLIFIFPEDG